MDLSTLCPDNTLIEMNTPSTQVFVLKYLSPLKETRMVDSRTEAEEVQDEPGTYCCARK